MQEQNKQKIEIDHLMSGADIIHVGEEQVALGFPEEVVKAWVQSGKNPTAWIIPDVRTADGIVQWALEFPLYYALFVQGLLGRGQKISVMVHERDWPDLVTYLRLTLLGLTPDEMAEEGVERETREILARESSYMALKRADGSVAQIEDFFEPIFFDQEGICRFHDLRIRSHGNNTYSIFAPEDRLEEYRLENGREEPPYATPLSRGSAPVLPQPFEVITLGTTSGFDANGPCSSTLLQANGRFLLVDCGPYVRALLRNAGVSLNQLGAVVITHAHEDHAIGLSALLNLTHRLKLFVTKETAAILRRKLAILNPTVDCPNTLLDDVFDVVLVAPGQVHDYFGLEMLFHYTMHSIPCTGAQFSVRDGREQRRVLIVGDNNAKANIEKAAEDGVLSEQRSAQLLAIYQWEGDLLIADAGGGAIHGLAEDFADHRAKDLVCVHTGALRPEEQHRFTLAEPGHRYSLIAEVVRPTPLERGLARKALSRAFASRGGPGPEASRRRAASAGGGFADPGPEASRRRAASAGGGFADPGPDASRRRAASATSEDGWGGFADPGPEEWQDAMLDAARPLSVNRGHIVVRQHERSSDLYIALTGELTVLMEKEGLPVEVASIHAGELFGEMAVINDAPRNASIRAKTPARLLSIPGEIFHRFAYEAGLLERLPELWSKRADLEAVSMLGSASVTTKNQLALSAVRRSVEPGATLIREGSQSDTVFVLVEGRAQVYKGNDPLLAKGMPVVLPPGSLLGETAPFLQARASAPSQHSSRPVSHAPLRNASIVAIDACEVLAIRGAAFKSAVEKSPQLFCGISQMVRQRQAA